MARAPFGEYPCPCDRSSSTDAWEEWPPSPGAHDEPPKKKQSRIKASRAKTRHRQPPANDEDEVDVKKARIDPLQTAEPWSRNATGDASCHPQYLPKASTKAAPEPKASPKAAPAAKEQQLPCP